MNPGPSISKGWQSVAVIAWLVTLAVGAVGMYQRFTQGHLPAGYGSYVPWGLWVALYFHGVGIAGGVFALAALGYIFEWPGFTSRASLRAAIVISAAGILPAFMGVWLDLGHLERALAIFTRPAFTSMMAFNAWMYGVFIVVAALAWWLTFRDDREWLKPLLGLGILFCVLFPSQSGAFFGVVDAKPYWHSALLPMMFLTSAFAAGSATLLLVRVLQGRWGLAGWDEGVRQDYEQAIARLRGICLVAVAVYFVFEFAEFSIVFWSPFSHAPALELVLFGPYWWVFWIVHLLLGGLVPMGLFLLRRRGAWTFAAALVALCFISARLNVLVPGQAVAEIQGLQEAFQHERLRYIYHATTMEYMVGAFLFGFGVAVFLVGSWISAWLARRLAPSTGGVS